MKEEALLPDVSECISKFKLTFKNVTDSEIEALFVDNAIKYTPAGSHIVLSAAAQGESAVIRVSDDGPGIPDEAKEKVFEMFSTGEKRISDSRRSLGLGLALCRTIIAAHGGTITLSDNTPHGCIFTYTLPLGEVSLHE